MPKLTVELDQLDFNSITFDVAAKRIITTYTISDADRVFSQAAEAIFWQELPPPGQTADADGQVHDVPYPDNWHQLTAGQSKSMDSLINNLRDKLIGVVLDDTTPASRAAAADAVPDDAASNDGQTKQ